MSDLAASWNYNARLNYSYKFLDEEFKNTMQGINIPTFTTATRNKYICDEIDSGRQTARDLSIKLGITYQRVKQIHERHNYKLKMDIKYKDILDVIGYDYKILHVLLRNEIDFNKLREMYNRDKRLYELSDVRDLGYKSLKKIRIGLSKKIKA